MLLYRDASCLVKLYADEEGSDVVRAWLKSGAPLVTSEIAYVEVCSSLARRQREGRHPVKSIAASRNRFHEDWPHIHRMILDPIAAARQILRHSLRALDAIHLAAAVSLHDAAPEVQMGFASFDARQCAAARAQGPMVVGAAWSVAPQTWYSWM